MSFSHDPSICETRLRNGVTPLVTDLVIDRLIERAEVGGRFSVRPPAAHHRSSAMFFEPMV